mmetsp:Transcript_12957/g.30918  ORF Transcript_12957/g.30918 Transcript_12957/m.30918 type:complete len:234 (-) Transcript_12957:799-1500(-)
MLMTQSARPAAALDFLRMASLLKCSSFSNGSTALKFCSGTLWSSMTCLNSLRFCMNFSGLFIIFCADFHDLSLTRPCLSTSTVGSMVAIRCITAAVMSSTPAGGLLKALASWKSFLSNVSRAASACSTRGMAFARSASQLACCSETSFWICAHVSASTLALSLSAVTFSFSLPTSSANASAATFFSSTTTCFSLRSASSPVTFSCVSRSLSRPLLRRSLRPSTICMFLLSMDV